MFRKYTREEIEEMLLDDSDFEYQMALDDRELYNVKITWRKDGSVSISAKKGKKIKIRNGARVVKPRYTIADQASECIDRDFHS